MKKKILSAITAAVAVSLCGCTNVDGKNTGNNEQNISIARSSSSIIDGELIVNFGENSALPEKAGIYLQKQKTFTKEQFLKLFKDPPTQDAESSFRYVNGNETGNFSEVSIAYFTNAGIFYETTAESFLSWKKTDRISTTEELSFCSREEAFKKAVEFLQNDLGIASETIMKGDFYSITKGAFELYKKEVTEEANAPLESGEYEEDREAEKQRAEALSKLPSVDYYYLSMVFKIDDIPLYSGGMFQYGANDAQAVSGTWCKIILSENGIEFVNVSHIFENDSSEPAKEAELIGGDKAKELIVKKYEDIIFEGEIEIDDMKLIYLPVPRQGPDAEGIADIVYETRPYYVFHCRKTEDRDGKTVETKYNFYIDAVTGEEFGEEHLW